MEKKKSHKKTKYQQREALWTDDTVICVGKPKDQIFKQIIRNNRKIGYLYTNTNLVPTKMYKIQKHFY